MSGEESGSSSYTFMFAHNFLEFDDHEGRETIRIHASKSLWLEADGYGEYMNGKPPHVPAKLAPMLNTFGDTGHNPTNLKKHRSSQNDPEVIQTVAEALRTAHIRVSSMDTFNIHEGNLYDFGGNPVYNIGNGYVENHMNPDSTPNDLNPNSKLNDLKEKDKAVAGGPLQDIASEKLSTLKYGQTWVEKTYNGNKYEYVYKTKTLITEYKTEEETHAYEKNSYTYSYGGRTEVTKYTAGGRKTYHSWSEGGKSSETCYDSTTGTMTTYEFKVKGHFTYEAAIPNYPRLKISTCAGNVLDTSISISASTKIDVDIAASAILKIKQGAGIEMKIQGKPLSFEFNNSSGKFVFSGPGTQANKEAAINAKLLQLVLEDATCFLDKKKIRIENGALMVGSKALTVTKGIQIQGI